MSNDFLTQEEIDTLLGKKEQADTPAPDERPGKFSPSPHEEGEMHPNLGAILEFPLQVSIRLGKARKTLQEIRKLSSGAVVELDRFVHEPLDIFIGGKLIAQGEVVIIEENFGIKITEIMDPMERVKKLR
ncbi:MAG: flagellar motor switch protein FliN [Dethiobacteria bacterium]|jgi:flagellar motor switch protein FliN/FliY